MPNPTVKCTVDQCVHNFQSQQCMAAGIAVYNNEENGKSRTSQDTKCQSFESNKTLGNIVGALDNVNVGGTMMAPLKEGVQMTPSVKCFVNNCKYWKTNNFCTAVNIQVNGENAATPDDTDCQTFEPH